MKIDGHFLVMGLSGLILHDIVGTINDKFPDLVACTAEDMADALAQIETAEKIHFAFLNIGPEDLVGSMLSDRLNAAGTRIVLMGNAAEEAVEHSPYPVLERPFLASTVLSTLVSDPEA